MVLRWRQSTLRLNHWWQMDYFDNVFHTFLGLDSVIYLAVSGTVTILPVFIHNILNCVLKTNKAIMGLERYGGKWLMTTFVFWGGVTLYLMTSKQLLDLKCRKQWQSHQWILYAKCIAKNISIISHVVSQSIYIEHSVIQYIFMTLRKCLKLRKLSLCLNYILWIMYECKDCVCVCVCVCVHLQCGLKALVKLL